MNAIASDPVGVIGAGRLGQAMTRTALRADRSVVIANSRGPKSLSSVVSTLGKGVSAATVDQAAAARIVIIAVPWDRGPDAVRGLQWNDQIVIDATNNWSAADLNGRTSSVLVADLVPGARVVKAGNTPRRRRARLRPAGGRGRRMIFVSGDDANAKPAVASLFEDAGFAAIDLRNLATGGAMQQIHHPLAGLNLIRL
jgi:predicted dinucleotide-binding enzyme